MNFLKIFREIEGLTQEELAAKLGISRAFISQLENKKKDMSVELLVKLCDETGYNSCFFLCDMFKKKTPLCNLCRCKELKGMPLERKIELFLEHTQRVRREIRLVKNSLDNKKEMRQM